MSKRNHNWENALDAWKRAYKEARNDADRQCAARWVDYWTRRITGRSKR